MSIEELKKAHELAFKTRAEDREITKQRNITITKMRYEQGFTLQAIGDRYGLTRERVRQIINTTLK